MEYHGPGTEVCLSTHAVHMGFPPGQSQEEHQAGGGFWGWAVWVCPPLGRVARVSQPPMGPEGSGLLQSMRSMGQGDWPAFLCAVPWNLS